MSSFEESLSTRLVVGKSDPVETDLDYYSKPENYTGSNLHAMQRVMFVQKKQNSDLGPHHGKEDPLDKLKERYKDIGRTDTPDSPERRLESRVSVADDQNSPTPSRKSLRSAGSRSGADGNDRTSNGKFHGVEVNIDDFDDDDDAEYTSEASFHQGPRRFSLTQSRLSGGNGVPYRASRSSIQTSGSLRDMKTDMAKERFRHAIKIVLILLKWISSLTEKEGEEESESSGSSGKTFTDIASDAFTATQFGNSELTFDVTDYKAKKEVNISNEVKDILSTNKYARTPEQLQTALYGLQHLKSFAEYPLHMQEKLCKVAWFQQVPPKRVIIRQGHFAENFYFILAGQAVVRILDKNPLNGETQLRTAAVMRKGMSFGELALLHHSRRTATVVSQDMVQLLAIGRDDFLDIFMSRSGPDEMPDHVKFISTLEFMRGWPVETLLDHPEYCLFHFFKRGVVIVKDSNQSEWLYIVKSGSCQVMKELKGVVPSVTKKKELDAKYAVRLPKLGADMFAAKVDTGLRRPPTRCSTPSTLTRALTEYDGFSRRSSAATARPGRAKSARTNRSQMSSTPTDGISSTKSEVKGPVFVQVEVLKPKDVFGLSTLKFEEDLPDDASTLGTSVSLVSNGAECIMLSKRFFAEHATDKVKSLIRNLITPYPSESTLQGNLQTKVDWDLYKKKLIRDMVQHKREVHNAFRVPSTC